jgi:ribosomal protein L7/L12
MNQTVLFVVFGVLFALVIFRRLVRASQRQGDVSDLVKRQLRTEAKVDLLLKHAGITFDPHANVPPGVLDALRAGNKIEAIRQYRQATGADLKAAKDFVESL